MFVIAGAAGCLLAAPAPRPAGDRAPIQGQSATAFTHVNVVPMDRERVLPDQTVIVRDGRIAEIGPASGITVPEGSRRIDGRGRYLMPGLADMHVHLVDQDGLVLYLANGVTTVRNMAGRPAYLAWRAAIAHGELLGPTIYTTGPIVDGSPPVWPGSAVVETAEQADSVVREQQAAGYDFIKVYGRLSRESFLAVLAAADRYGIRAVGHVPPSVGIDLALSAGLASVEHLTGYLDAVRPENPPVDLDWSGLSADEVRARQTEIGARLLRGDLSLDDLMDAKRLTELAEATRAAGVWNVPTLVVHQRTSLAGAAWEAALAEPEMAYVPAQVMSYWRSSDEARRDLSPERARFLDAWRERERRIVEALHDAGARLLLGTDTPNPFVVPGFSVQMELRNLVKAGLTPYEAIRAGTHDAAEFLDALDHFGTVSVGRRADLVLLEADPLQDVSNVARRVGVMVRGRWLPEAELRSRLAALAASYAPASDGL